jgi:hypothetical protein
VKQGDLMYCTFGPHGFATILSAHPFFNSMFWNILWNGEVVLMHEDHLVAV